MPARNDAGSLVRECGDPPDERARASQRGRRGGSGFGGYETLRKRDSGKRDSGKEIRKSGKDSPEEKLRKKHIMLLKAPERPAEYRRVHC